MLIAALRVVVGLALGINPKVFLKLDAHSKLSD